MKRDPDFNFLTVTILEATRTEETEGENSQKEDNFDDLTVLMLHTPCRNR